MMFLFVVFTSGVFARRLCPDSEPHTPSLQNILPPNRSCCRYFVKAPDAPSPTSLRIPSVLLPAFTLWNRTRLLYGWDTDSGAYTRPGAEWSRSLIDRWIDDVNCTFPVRSSFPGSVEQFIAPALDEFPVYGKRGCVIGAETPWLEALLLARGATHITTIEDGAIVSRHPRVAALTPAMAWRATLEPFDFCISYAIFEHSGLGRFGERLNPFGDFELLERVHCLLKPHGLFYNGIPTSTRDCLIVNVRRIYGPYRLQLLGEQNHWQPLGLFGKHAIDTCAEWHLRPVHVWRKRD